MHDYSISKKSASTNIIYEYFSVYFALPLPQNSNGQWPSVGIHPHVILIDFLDFSVALVYRNNEAMLSLARTNCFRDSRRILFGVNKKTTLTA